METCKLQLKLIKVKATDHKSPFNLKDTRLFSRETQLSKKILR
ncbi:hypothetical protein H1P_2560009 [Hyella patelloides LEGE 07179]|uniref:Uncharacterized protein n=1 Tax=Hyella patelloides LEGE 07179 TaxID=945734 RepID=A0A563VS80_9CYAN|nr:hypothetical protein H1P_2560009 [Hyella patelloides LEGE 07179]